VISAVPVAVAVNVTEQLPETSVQVVELNDPAGPVSVKVTVPVGGVAPAPAVSVTVAAHVVTWLTTTVPGEQETLVLVGSTTTTPTLSENMPWLPLWTESDAAEVKTPVIVSVRGAVPEGE